MTPAPRRFALVLRDDPSRLDEVRRGLPPAPLDRRLAAALKRLLRGYGLRVETYREIAPEGPADGHVV
jgi:hypothetical protein